MFKIASLIPETVTNITLTLNYTIFTLIRWALSKNKIFMQFMLFLLETKCFLLPETYAALTLNKIKETV